MSGANHVGQTCVAAPLSIMSSALLFCAACDACCIASCEAPRCEPPSPGVWRPTCLASVANAVMSSVMSSTVATMRSTAETRCSVGAACGGGGSASCAVGACGYAVVLV